MDFININGKGRVQFKFPTNVGYKAQAISIPDF